MMNWIAFQLVMHGPWRVTCSADNFIGRWCLPRAGGHAYPNRSDIGNDR